MADKETQGRVKSYASQEVQVFTSILALQLTDEQRLSVQRAVYDTLEAYDPTGKRIDAKHQFGFKALADLLRRPEDYLTSTVEGYFVGGPDIELESDKAAEPQENRKVQKSLVKASNQMQLFDVPIKPIKPDPREQLIRQLTTQSVEMLLKEYELQKWEDGLYPWPSPMIQTISLPDKTKFEFLAVGTFDCMTEGRFISGCCKINEKKLHKAHPDLLRDPAGDALIRSRSGVDGPKTVRYVYGVALREGTLLKYYAYQKNGQSLGEIYGIVAKVASDKMIIQAISSGEYSKIVQDRTPSSNIDY